MSYMTETAAQIPAAELYVIAIGTNDVRYRDESLCAMTPDQYTDRLDALKNKLLSASPGADFVFIAPWYSTDGDPFCTLPFAEKTALNEAYSAALGTYCKENGLKYINANDLIREKLSASPERDYLLDHIHPNPGRGVRMYTEAVLLS